MLIYRKDVSEGSVVSRIPNILVVGDSPLSQPDSDFLHSCFSRRQGEQVEGGAGDTSHPPLIPSILTSQFSLNPVEVPHLVVLVGDPPSEALQRIGRAVKRRFISTEGFSPPTLSLRPPLSEVFSCSLDDNGRSLMRQLVSHRGIRAEIRQSGAPRELNKRIVLLPGGSSDEAVRSFVSSRFGDCSFEVSPNPEGAHLILVPDGPSAAVQTAIQSVRAHSAPIVVLREQFGFDAVCSTDESNRRVIQRLFLAFQLSSAARKSRDRQLEKARQLQDLERAYRIWIRVCELEKPPIEALKKNVSECSAGLRAVQERHERRTNELARAQERMEELEGEALRIQQSICEVARVMLEPVTKELGEAELALKKAKQECRVALKEIALAERLMAETSHTKEKYPDEAQAIFRKIRAEWTAHFNCARARIRLATSLRAPEMDLPCG